MKEETIHPFLESRKVINIRHQIGTSPRGLSSVYQEGEKLGSPETRPKEIVKSYQPVWTLTKQRAAQITHALTFSIYLKRKIEEWKIGPGTNIGYGLKEIAEMTDEVDEAREVLHLLEKTHTARRCLHRRLGN
jgi:hypothetical protein